MKKRSAGRGLHGRGGGRGTRGASDGREDETQRQRPCPGREPGPDRPGGPAQRTAEAGEAPAMEQERDLVAVLQRPMKMRNTTRHAMEK